MKSHGQIAAEIGELVARKNVAYGDSLAMVGTILALHFPQGIPLDRYDDAFLLARIFDKTMRFAQKNDPLGESPLTDIAGYAIAGLGHQQHMKEHDPRWQGNANGPDAHISSSVKQPASAEMSAKPGTRSTGCASSEAGPTPSEPASAPSAKTSSVASPTCSTSSAATAATILSSESADDRRRWREALPHNQNVWISRNTHGHCAACDKYLPSRADRRYWKTSDAWCFAACTDDCALFLGAQ